ncbi:MAG: 1,2-phenylacetyl-CoA epoxidase subunit B [Bacteroidia bacterium]|nr:1,2-phenylacetyl-CoA epoxidase subunit B [Bacteroidia bacterium]
MSEEEKKESISWPVWEVFIQPKTGRPHEHCGSVRAPDPEIALQNARDVYTRRGEGTSIWVVKSDNILATKETDAGPFFEPADDKLYRYPNFYTSPKGVKI